MTIKIKDGIGLVKHAGYVFTPGQVIDFEDDGVEDYFVKCGWADPVSEDAQFAMEKGSITYIDEDTGKSIAGIDPRTRHNESGLLIKDLVVSTGTEEKK